MGYTVASGLIYVSLSRGLTHSLQLLNGRITVKVAPSIATSFFTYEVVKDFLIGPPL